MVIGILLLAAGIVAVINTEVAGIIVFISGSWLISEWGMWPYRKFKTSNDFELTKSEHQSLRSAVSNANTARNEEAKAQQKIADLERKGRNLRRTKSGKFDGRSKLGKKLNKELPRAQVIAFRTNNEAAKEEAKVLELTEIPQTRARGWIKSEAARSANRIVIICFACILFVCFVGDAKPADIWPVLFLGAVGLMYLTKYIYQRRLSSQLGVT